MRLEQRLSRLACLAALLLLSGCDHAALLGYALGDTVSKQIDLGDPFGFDPHFGPPGATRDGACPCPSDDAVTAK